MKLFSKRVPEDEAVIEGIMKYRLSPHPVDAFDHR